MIKRFSFLGVLLLALMVFVLVLGCAGLGSNDSEGEKTLKIVGIFQVPYIDFYVPTRIGMEDAAKEFGFDFEYMGPVNNDVNDQIAMIETAIEKGVDGIIVEVIDPQALGPVVGKAKERGIPIVLTNELAGEDVGYDGRCGADPYAIGELMGQQMEKILKGEGPWAKSVGFPGGEVEGKIAYTLDSPGSLNLERRIDGAWEYLAGFTGITNVGRFDSTVTVDRGKEVVNDILTANPDLRGLITVGTGPSIAAGMAVKDAGKEGEVVIIGMDLLPQILELIKEGVIALTIGQNQYDQGYLPAKAIYEHLAHGKPIPEVMHTELEVVDLLNVEEIMEREEDILSKGK